MLNGDMKSKPFLNNCCFNINDVIHDFQIKDQFIIKPCNKFCAIINSSSLH
jgi:hypothetical protein